MLNHQQDFGTIRTRLINLINAVVSNEALREEQRLLARDALDLAIAALDYAFNLISPNTALRTDKQAQVEHFFKKVTGRKNEEEVKLLKFMLTKLQFDPFTECCPSCGGNQHHDGACEVAALIDPDHANTYHELTGMTIQDALEFDIANPRLKTWITQGEGQ